MSSDSDSLRSARQAHRDGPAAARRALELELAGVEVDDALRHREPEAAGAVHREERLEEQRLELRRDTGPVVRHGDRAAVAADADLHPDAPAVRACGVGEE